MTKEDIKQICQIYDNLRREQDAVTIAYNSDDAFWEHVLATYNLSQPSLPDNLDEVTEEASKEWHEDSLGRMTQEAFPLPFIRGFKAGVKWMIKQIK